jgi:hypothetical protein
VAPSEERHGRTRARQEWADWAAHGYGKRYQPRSMLVAGFVFFVLFGAFLIAVVVLAGRGRL